MHIMIVMMNVFKASLRGAELQFSANLASDQSWQQITSRLLISKAYNNSPLSEINCADNGLIKRFNTLRKKNYCKESHENA